MFLRGLFNRLHKEEHEETERACSELESAIQDEKNKTQEIAWQTRRLVEAKARNHFVEQLTAGFAFRINQ